MNVNSLLLRNLQASVRINLMLTPKRFRSNVDKCQLTAIKESVILSPKFNSNW